MVATQPSSDGAGANLSASFRRTVARFPRAVLTIPAFGLQMGECQDSLLELARLGSCDLS